VFTGESEEIEAFLADSMPELHALAARSNAPLNPVTAVYKRVSVNSAYFVCSKYEKNKVTRNSVVRVCINEGASTVFHNGILDTIFCYNPYPSLKESTTLVLFKCEWYKNAPVCPITELDRVSMQPQRSYVRNRRVNVIVDATSVVVTNVLVIKDAMSPESMRLSYIVDFEKRYC
jgi:hypothetical protein